MLTPDYGGRVIDKKMKTDVGPVIYCPECKKPLGEGEISKFKTRCKHCREWVYIYKKS